MIVTIDELHERLEELLERAAHGERIVVRESRLGPGIVLQSLTSRLALPDEEPRSRRRHRSPRTIAEVLADDRAE